MKFNMGCGRKRLDGYVNVDATPACEPDEVWDLERTPWPWPDGCAEEVLFHHSLEHMGGEPKVFLAIMQELYRILAPGGKVMINVPHPRHDNFIGDPTHVRPIIPETLHLFDRRMNDDWVARGGSNTPLAHYTGVDFRLLNTQVILDEPYWSKLNSGELSKAEVDHLLATASNIAREIRFVLEARKPG